MKSFLSLIVITFCFVFCSKASNCSQTFKKANKVYDFSFAELAVKYLESGDTILLTRLASLDATQHLLNHADRFHYNVPINSGRELVGFLLAPFSGNMESLEKIRQNLQFAKDSIALTDFPRQICLQYLPGGFAFEGKLFFTVGYDIGVVYADNASLNIAHPRFLKKPQEMKFYAVHELHHAGFVQLKDKQMPSLDITTYGEMARLIEYFTHLEGMGTYAPLKARIKHMAHDIDPDYVALMHTGKMELYEKEFFTIYFQFKDQPHRLLQPDDWQNITPLTDGKRLWYRVGAHMAREIDQQLGRENLVGLLTMPPNQFFETYLSLQQ